MESSGSDGRPRSDYAPSSIDHLTDAQLVHAIAQGRKTYRGRRIAFGDHNVSRVDETTVAKYSGCPEDYATQPSEALTLDLVFRRTTIPVPRVRRVVTEMNQGPLTWIVMDYIPGRQLSAVWPAMSVEERLRVVFTLRDYVRQLRGIRHPRAAVPGPLSSGDDALQCTSPVFGKVIEERGPFASYAELSAWFDHAQRVVARNLNAKKHPQPVSFDAVMGTSSLVLCHQDLNMRNVIVGDDGRLWLVDWAWAGFYPPWFEYLAMKEQSKNEEMVMERKEPFWDLMIPFICGTFYREEEWMHSSVHNALGYRFESTP
ncbi:kinase-like domain-containing protein [Fomitopsis serialis]|uniref:kinase-like domain-containing protein n=1 Tax=Fomitopsis serialis TaxID=139415 RepID=UPI0020072A5E|nr:kinase-like domain-containing protein [Neoantrodia serialis]KAH9913540.1 kinase-like domain-containing protein [Neoantrodia serialis]